MKKAGPSAVELAVVSLRSALSGSTRERIVVETLKSRTFDRSVRHLRDGMRAHRFPAEGQDLFSGSWVKSLDHVTRGEGFHILHDWDGKADRFCDDVIPVEVANFVERVADPVDQAARRSGLFVMLDYYFLHLIALLAIRGWDEGDASANLDAVDDLLAELQGNSGSGQKFARDAATLLLIATSHFEPDVTAYDRLLAKVKKLSSKHRLNLAQTHAAILGSHLRFGLEVTCAGSVPALRDDNLPDYPWLCEALAVLLEHREAHGGSSQPRVDEALLIGLTPDAAAFLDPRPPIPLQACTDRRDTVRRLVSAERPALLRAFERHRPVEPTYSPLAFTFNFPHNLVKGIVVDAVLRGSPWSLGLDDLLTAAEGDEEKNALKVTLARRLMGYALASPDTIRGEPHPAIVYDAAAGRRVFETTIRRLAAD